MTDALTPADRQALEVPIAATRDDTATDAWLARQDATDGPPLIDRVESDDTLPDTQRLILRAKIAARDSAAESSRVATVKGLDDQLAAATKAIAIQPSQYRIGTLNALAQAYADAGEPDKANDTRRWRRRNLSCACSPRPVSPPSSAGSTTSPAPSARWPRRSWTTRPTPSPRTRMPPAPRSIPTSGLRCRRRMPTAGSGRRG